MRYGDKPRIHNPNIKYPEGIRDDRGMVIAVNRLDYRGKVRERILKKFSKRRYPYLTNAERAALAFFLKYAEKVQAFEDAAEQAQRDLAIEELEYVLRQTARDYGVTVEALYPHLMLNR